MPTSSSADAKAHARPAGFTLVEMLIVLAILAVAAGAVALGMGTARDGGEGEARRLAARLSYAADAAMVDDRVVGFDWDEKGYRFIRAGAKGWEPEPGDALEPHALPGGLTLAAAGPHPLPIGADEGGQPLDLRIEGRRGGWIVHFDGVAATVTAGARP